MGEPNSSFEKLTVDKDLEKIGVIESATQFVLHRAAAPGLALIFLAGSAIFAALFVSAGVQSVVIVAAAVLAAYMAMNIGANDVTNNVGAAVGARAISMSGALVLAAFCEIAGAVIAGGNVVATIKSDIVSPLMLASTDQIIDIMMAALLAAALWINLATWINAPVSTTHSIIGSIIGAGATIAGVGAVKWSSMAEITLSWIVSPILGAAIASGFLWLIMDRISYREDKLAAARNWVPLLLALMTGSFLAYILVVTSRATPGFRIWHAVLIGLFLGGASYIWFRDAVARQSVGLENRNASLKVLFRLPLIFSAALLSFAHGANDVANAIGPLAAIVEASGIQSVARNLDAPFWVLMIGALGISTGILLYGPRLIRIVGTQITKLNPARAYCVAMSTAITVILASALGLPVSTTHIAVGSVFGVGLFREWYAVHSVRRRTYLEQRAESAENASAQPLAANVEDADDVAESHEHRYRYLVRRSYLLSILAAWIVTVPVSGLLAAFLAMVMVRLPG
jgi:PiT family inorganic phosphate transporter